MKSMDMPLNQFLSQNARLANKFLDDQIFNVDVIGNLIHPKIYTEMGDQFFNLKNRQSSSGSSH
jgi:hypothetical protein